MTEEMGGKICSAQLSNDALQIFRKKQDLRVLFFFAFTILLNCYASLKVKIPLEIIASAPNHKIAAITDVIIIFFSKFGFAGAEVA